MEEHPNRKKMALVVGLFLVLGVQAQAAQIILQLRMVSQQTESTPPPSRTTSMSRLRPISVFVDEQGDRLLPSFNWCPVPEISVSFVAIKMGRRQGARRARI